MTRYICAWCKEDVKNDRPFYTAIVEKPRFCVCNKCKGLAFVHKPDPTIKSFYCPPEGVPALKEKLEKEGWKVLYLYHRDPRMAVIRAKAAPQKGGFFKRIVEFFGGKNGY